MAESFFELRTEEIPAWMHDAAQATLLQQLTKLTQDLGEPPDDRNPVIVNSTPRRIIFFLSRIPLRESDREEEVKGPPAKAAYDAEGKPTQALNGFLKKNNATINDLIPGGDYIRVKRTIKGRSAGGIPSVDASIWSQWQYLTEYPGVVRAEFGKEYLSLPDEVLVTVMRVHQKQLPIRTAEGQLTSSFLAVLDNDADPDGNAAYGNSFVTNARFADAQFFYETDRKRTLESRLEQLEHLQFQEKLGNYLEKTKRIEKIVAAIFDDADTSTAARLCKTDLVTEMVKEFTDLQGQIGGIYAREEGMSANTWQAIYDHYLPVNLEDALPRTRSGVIVSLADKIDTLVGFFLICAKPTCSRDPFALRRAAQGVIQILLNRDKRQVSNSLNQLIDAAFAAYRTVGLRVTYSSS